MQLVPPVWHSIVPIPILCTHNQIDAASQASSRPARQRERERERDREGARTGDCRAKGLNPPHPHLLQIQPHNTHHTSPSPGVPSPTGWGSKRTIRPIRSPPFNISPQLSRLTTTLFFPLHNHLSLF